MKKRSNIKLYQLIVLIAVVFAGFSCSDKFFNEQAGERITPDEYYKSTIDAENSLGGAIIPLQGVMPNQIMIDGLRSDMMTVTNRADAYLVAINNQSFTLDNPYIDASDYYKVIVNVNEALANLDKVAENDRKFDPYILHYFKGALVGLRCWTYLNLVKIYGEAALIPDNMAALPAGMNQTFLSKSVMIDTLINQITPYIYDNVASAKYVEVEIGGYPNSKAVLGELYLEKNNYANASKYLKMALESYKNLPARYKVDKTYTKDNWGGIFFYSEYGTSENISVMPYNSNEGQVNPLAKWMLYSDMYMVKPTQVLIDSFKTQIPTSGEPGDFYRGQGVTYDTTATGEPYISKYALDIAEPYSTDIIISRATDLHLLLAEALNRMGDSKTALILLNAGFAGEKTKPAPYSKWNTNLGVRGRALLTPKLLPDSLVVDSLHKRPLEGMERTEYVEDLIINERALELAFEGKRWFDLVRIAERRQQPAYLADKVAAKFTDPAKASEIHAILMDQTKWYIPFKK